MYLGIFAFSSLIFDVFGNRCFGVSPSDRVDEIAASPKRASPELLLHFRILLEYFPRRDALYRLNDILRQEHGYGLHEKMHMILVGANFKKMDVVSLGDLKAGLLDRFINLLRDDYSTVLRRTDDMINDTANIVAFVQIKAHARIIHRPQQAAGN